MTPLLPLPLLFLLPLGAAPAQAAGEEGVKVQVVLEHALGAPLPRLPRGAVIESQSPGQLQLSLPASMLPDLAGLGRLRRPWLASPKAITTEGYADLFPAGDWHAAGHTGRGQHIVVLDVGFQGAEGLAGGELPADVVRLGPGGLESSAHGVAVAEILHDIAPDAEISLWLFRTDVEFLAALDQLPAVAGRVDVVNASIGFDNVWHSDGSSPLSQAVDAFVAETGAVWVGAAGNEEGRYRSALLTMLPEEEGRVALGGAPEVPLALSGGAATASLRWSEPMAGAQTDLRLRVVGEDGAVCGESEAPWDGRPYVWVAASGCGAAAVAQILLAEGGPVEGLVGHLHAPQGFGEAGWATTGQTLTLPADAHRALAVGACGAAGAEAYSSQGPTEDGRLKPDLCALGAVSTATYGPGGFVGTSAAAPHVAGLAALLRDAEGGAGAGAGEVRAHLRRSAQDVGEAGADPQTGHGMAQLGAPPPRCGGRLGGVGLLGLAWGWRRRRVAVAWGMG